MYSTLHIAISFALGFISGAIAVLLLNKQNFHTDKVVSLLIIGTWLGMHAIGFALERDVAWIFDILGAGSAGHIVGIDITKLLKRR